DGYDATALIRASEAGRKRTPIIALTANDSDDDRQRCVDVGMDGFVAKPLRPAELFATIEQVLTSAGTRPGATGGAAAAPVGSSGSGDVLQDLREALASLTRHAEAGDVPAVLQAAALATDLAD